MGKFFTILVIALAAVFSAITYRDRSIPYENFINTPVVTAFAGGTDGNLIGMLEETDAVVIQLGLGGRVNGMLDTLEYLRRHPKKTIVIDGECYSACTMLLSAPNNVLLTDNARMFFHSGTETTCVDGLKETRLSPSANAKMLALFGPAQRAWIHNTNAFGSTDFTEMPKALVHFVYSDMMISSQGMPDRIDQDFQTTERPKPTKPESCRFILFF